MSHKSEKSKHPCLFPTLGEKYLVFHHKYRISCIRLRKLPPMDVFLRVSIMNDCRILLNAFIASITQVIFPPL